MDQEMIRGGGRSVGKRLTLQRELDQLAHTNPEVAEAARKYDETIEKLVTGSRMDRYRAHLRDECDEARCQYRHPRTTEEDI